VLVPQKVIMYFDVSTQQQIPMWTKNKFQVMFISFSYCSGI